MAKMMAARLYEIGEPLRLEQVPVPVPGPNDVVVAVKACNIVPNLKNVLGPHWSNLFPELHRPKLPAIFGLDVAGIVAEVGKEVWQIHPGDRVYVNPGARLRFVSSMSRWRHNQLRQFYLPGLFRPRSAGGANSRDLPLWWPRRIYDGAAKRAGEAAGQRNF